MDNLVIVEGMNVEIFWPDMTNGMGINVQEDEVKMWRAVSPTKRWPGFTPDCFEKIVGRCAAAGPGW